MTSLPITRNAPHPIYPVIRTAETFSAGWLRAATADRNLIIIGAVCLIGLLVTLNLIFRFPSFAPSLEELAQILG